MNNIIDAQRKLNDAALALMLSQEGRHLEPEEDELHEAVKALLEACEAVSDDKVRELFLDIKETVETYIPMEIEP